MSDYIKREDAIKSLCKMCLVGEYEDGVCRYMSNGECAEIEDIKDIPSADVIEPKRGKWIYCEDDDGQDGYKCSECGFFVPWYYDYEDSNYILDYKVCPYCGADMRGNSDDV